MAACDSCISALLISMVGRGSSCAGCCSQQSLGKSPAQCFLTVDLNCRSCGCSEGVAQSATPNLCLSV